MKPKRHRLAMALRMVWAYAVWVLLWLSFIPSLMFLIAVLGPEALGMNAVILTAIILAAFVLAPLYTKLLIFVLAARPNYRWLAGYKHIFMLSYVLLILVSATCVYLGMAYEYGFSIPTNSYGYRYDKCVLANGAGGVEGFSGHDCVDANSNDLKQP